MPAIRKMPYAAHQFVMARPLSRDWSYFDGSTSKQGNEEFRPVMIRGHEHGQRIFCIGTAYGYDLDQFEIGQDLSPPYGGVKDGEPV
jgi:hypothetical protein